MQSVTFKKLQVSDINEIVNAFELIGWHKPRSTYEHYLSEQDKGQRTAYIARMEGVFCGYVTIKWQSDNSLFNQHNIPEIVDLNVLPKYQKQGIGKRLIQKCEQEIKAKGYKKIGIGVGMTADYGNAQRLYVKLGYIPDGNGIHYKHKPTKHGELVTIDDDLVLFLTKDIE